MTCIQAFINDWAILGRPSFLGPPKKSALIELDRRFGSNNWLLSYQFDKELLSKDSLMKLVERSYSLFFKTNPEVFKWLLSTTKDIHETAPLDMNTTTDFSLQGTTIERLCAVAIRRVVKEMGCSFNGTQLLQIAGENSNGYVLSVVNVPFCEPEKILKPIIKGHWSKNSIASFFHNNRILAVKFRTLQKLGDNMVGIVLRKDIHMGKGKFSTQAAHALVSLISEGELEWDFHSQPIEIWTTCSEENLLSIYRKARKSKLRCSLIQDAGKTQLKPGTFTAVGLGVVNEALFDRLMILYDSTPLESKTRAYCFFDTFKLFPYHSSLTR
ncbi:hypothetical protein DRO91_03760 [Candidatus Heimdallarchaeota archaeon]|nr:MAG: hypothetical protein DRP02_01245 [Candidatus Gerdarchaeota archaeon]RLI73067.1 MAG: hypothetical protein DRO91_03760 [Candidatus Heimdallarchaeota archaeon]